MAPQVVRSQQEQICGPILSASSPYNWYTAYYLQLPPDLGDGTVILATATFEVTNPYPFNVQCDRYIALGTSWGQNVEPTPLMPVTASNVTPNQHHMRDTVTAVIDDASLAKLELTWANLAGQYLSLILAGAAISASAGQALVLEHGYGELIAMIFRP